MEGFKILIESIKREWKIGLSQLPIHQFDIYFRGSIGRILEQDIEGLKHWFITVRLGRMLHQDHHLLEDEFSHNGPMAQWVGLPSR